MFVCPPPLPPLPRRGWVAHPEPAPPSPFPSPDCLSEYRKNKLCRWPPASQKHLMSRSAQAALQGCINLEEFPAWELLPGGRVGCPPSKLCPPRGVMYSLPSLGVHRAPLQLLLHPSRNVFLLLSSPLQSFGAERLLSWEPDALLCPRRWGAAGASGGLRGVLPPTSDVER